MISVETIAKSLGKASRQGQGWICLCPAHDDHNPSLSLSLQDGKLLVHCFAECGFRDILSILQRRGLLPETRSYEQPSKPPPQRPSQKPLDDPADAKKRVKATYLWNASQNALGTPVEAYLRSRGLTILPPETLRFHQNLEYWEQDGDGNPRLLGRFPAMVACVQKWPSDEITGVHRTYLRADGQGKADVPSPKKMLGDCIGGAVRFPGECIDGIAVGEGIESSLSFLQFNPLMTVWAALSSKGLERIVVPDLATTQEVVVIVDNDPAGHKAYDRLASRLTKEGKKVYPAMTASGDFNDLLTDLKEDSYDQHYSHALCQLTPRGGL